MTFKAVFPNNLAQVPEIGGPEAFEAVSGGNIPILPVDASVLRAHKAAR
jgi:hypothetical protein